MWVRGIVAAMVAMSGCAAGERPVESGPRRAVVWNDCGDGFECGRLSVPLDHGDPGGERLYLSLVRLPATGRRIGSLVINPGGPGGSGVEYARSAPAHFSAAVRGRFDIVGFDPRGVGESAPIDCLSDERLTTFHAIDTTPDTGAERRAYERAARGFADACQERSARLLPHMSTIDSARDLDLLREALGDAKLTYLGKSYGTFLGALYADMYPGKVRALVLDGGVDPSMSRLRHNAEQAEGFERAFRAYAADCRTQGECPVGSVEALTGLLRRTDRVPLTSDGGRPVTEALATLGALTPLYDRSSWPALTQALRAARSGDGTRLLENAESLIGRTSDGTYTNQTEAAMATTCLDGPHPRDPSAYAAPPTTPFGPYISWSALPCAYWPAPPRPIRPLRGQGAPPILVIGTTRDPATPHPWARSLANQLASGTLLTYDADGHTAYGGTSPCVDRYVDTYLISLTAPSDGSTC
ncbi:alpha/beta hydrolase [Nonomuraea longicatena]|uniref:Alpha/beta hydrolase n=2 Tax=Nonomuraea longicatena TaxID=83682 RepID=A0ABN1NVT1_9ACTN